MTKVENVIYVIFMMNYRFVINMGAILNGELWVHNGSFHDHPTKKALNNSS